MSQPHRTYSTIHCTTHREGPGSEAEHTSHSGALSNHVATRAGLAWVFATAVSSVWNVFPMRIFSLLAYPHISCLNSDVSILHSWMKQLLHLQFTEK